MKAHVVKKEILLEVSDMQMLLVLFSEFKAMCVQNSFSTDKSKIETVKHLYTLISSFESQILNVVFRDEADNNQSNEG